MHPHMPMSREDVNDAGGFAAGIAAAWRLLPLRELQWSSGVVPAAVLQQIAALTGLTRLDLSSGYGPSSDLGYHMQATHAELALALMQLTALRCLSIREVKSMAVPPFGAIAAVVAELQAAGLAAAALYASEVARVVDHRQDALDADSARAFKLSHGCGSAALLLQAVGTLHTSQQVRVELLVRLKPSSYSATPKKASLVEAQQIQILQDVLGQVLPKRLLSCLQVTGTQIALHQEF